MPGYPTDRVIVYNRDATYAFELTPDEQRSRRRIEEINGEHSLTIKTTRRLTEGMRLITQDDTGKVREHVVYKTDEGHHEGKYAIGTYLCMWSLQYDLTTSYAEDHAEPGMGSSCTSRAAVVVALDGQSLWTVGTCDAPSVSAGKGCVMIGISDWERLSLVVEHWHGEVDAEIVMDGTRVVSRKVNLLAHVGSSEVTRRFDWAEDLTSIDRHEDPGPYYCRVVPLGRGQREYAEDDETEFDWPIDISEETPDGRVYIEDSESAQVFRTKLPDGTWHYPTKVVHYDEDDPELLLNAAMEDLHNHTRPGASYEASVLQFARAGMDVKGVQLGDNTQCVDFGFSPDAGLTLEGRITRLEVEELAPETETILTIGDLAPTFAQTMQELVSRQTASISDGIKRVEGGGTIAYVEGLLDAINAEINGTGGYTYIAAGEGAITYDRAVANPVVGTEATQVTQMKGGSLRFANSKKPAFSGINDWNWATVITPEGFLGLAATIAAITTGFIGSENGTYIDLDDNTASFGPTDGYHFTVDTNGIRHWYGSTLLGQYLRSSMQLGEESKAHIVVNDGGMALYDGNHNAYLRLADLTASGYIISEYVQDGTTYTYTAKHTVISSEVGGVSYPRVMVEYVYVVSSTTYFIYRYIPSDGWSRSGNTFTIDPSYLEREYVGHTLTVRGFIFKYQTSDTTAQAFTFGTRINSSVTSTIGGLSFTSGTNNYASGDMSSAFGMGLLAESDYQHVVGRYNKADTNGVYAFIVGNGTASQVSQRSNAFTLTWAGDIDANSAKLTNPLSIQYGGTGQSGMVTITDKDTLLTAASKVTVSSVEFRQFGKVATLYLSYSYTNGTFNPTTSGWCSGPYTICTLKSGYRPASYMLGVGSERGGSYSLSTSGDLTLRSFSISSSSTSHSASVTFTYLLR